MRGIDIEQQIVDSFFLLLCAFAFIDVGKFVALVVSPYLRHQTQGFLFVGFFQQFQRCGDIGTPAFGILGHLVETCTVVVVLQLTERFHSFVQIVVDDGKAVA